LKKDKGVVFFAITELCIGLLTLIGVGISLIFAINTKPPAVLAFVILSSLLSLLLGVGLFGYRRWAYYTVLYFAVTIILSKILIFSKIIYLHGALETKVPEPLKNLISIIYHTSLILYLRTSKIKEAFFKKR
jgi:hypothetical protein